MAPFMVPPKSNGPAPLILKNLFICGTDQGMVGIIGAMTSAESPSSTGICFASIRNRIRQTELGLAIASPGIRNHTPQNRLGFRPLTRPSSCPKIFSKVPRSATTAIVIGSGLAGMTAANTLARSGRSVLLLEQHYKLGGMATWFKRPGGHIFDISLHGFPVGMVKSCRRYWTSEIADSIVQLKNIRFDNPMFSLTTTFDRQDFTRLLIERFAVPAATVTAFFDAARNMNFFDDQSTTRRRAVRAVLSRPRGRGPAADGADHLCQWLDAGRPGHHLWHRLFEFHVQGRLHLRRGHRPADPA